MSANRVNDAKNALQVEMQREYKARIKQLGLIKSGRMLNDLTVVVTLNDDGFISHVKSTDYFPEVDELHGLTDYIINLPEIGNLMANLYGEIIIDILD